MARTSDTSTARRWGVGGLVLLVLAGLVVTVVIGLVRGATAPVETVTVDDLTTPGAPAADLYVHVSGAVAGPGLYVLADGARVMDAVAAAGGFTGDADSAAVNLARPIADGEQLHVPAKGEAPVPATGSASGGAGPIDLNTADVAALETLPGIGPTLGGRIVAWREENGRFTSVDDLLAVPGIGEKLLAGMRDLIVV
ncbi:ComEA family DNA-binding protein [Microbacterium sp. UBA3394]|uniref:ComEA family DNA-binding protein n=1 Tax=Microbacterium sp. UBA3394 TaxID=1946945 RepID=UPI0008D9CAD8|nr:ComEA family DNA-binding protein [Microbacterium sp. UBA3394]